MLGNGRRKRRKSGMWKEEERRKKIRKGEKSRLGEEEEKIMGVGGRWREDTKCRRGRWDWKKTTAGERKIERGKKGGGGESGWTSHCPAAILSSSSPKLRSRRDANSCRLSETSWPTSLVCPANGSI